jgi:formiminoglutamase
MEQFVFATKEYVNTLVGARAGETKLGQKVQLVTADNWQETLRTSAAKYVLLGIPEDIGVRANLGVGGAHTAWEPALKAILNVQNTPALRGETILLLGWFDLAGWMKEAEEMSINQLRQMVARIDELVYPLIRSIVATGKIPVVIGGGHNNAYPLLKGCSLALDRPVNTINLDAHCDYRIMEGRHSGNGFRYARHDGFLERYAMVGLHKNYNSEPVIADMRHDGQLHFSFYEDIFLHEKQTFKAALDEGLAHVRESPFGVELDLDCIENIVSSAMTPCGVSSVQARQLIQQAKYYNPVYLHLTEGAVQLRNGVSGISAAKLIAYLATDFMRAD